MAVTAKEIRRKAKRRKYLPIGYRCDMSVGWSADFTGMPTVIMCPDQPVKFYPEFGGFGVYLCDNHAELQLQKYEE